MSNGAAQPTADVTIALISSDTTEGTVSPSTLTFTPQNFSTPQTVTVTGVDDDERDGNKAFKIITSEFFGADPNFIDVNPPDISVVNLDNDGIAAARAAALLAASTAKATAASDSIVLTFAVALTADSAGDAGLYSVEVNGEAIEVESVSVGGAGRGVTIGLPEGSLKSGDAVIVRGNGLSDGKSSYKGQTGTLTAH